MSKKSGGMKRTREGVVVSAGMDKTIVVAVQRLTPHPVYGRVLRRTTKFKAHDAENACRAGDQVRIVECRPLSKTKSWRLEEILVRAK